jgi:hypothetical protein
MASIDKCPKCGAELRPYDRPPKVPIAADFAIQLLIGILVVGASFELEARGIGTLGQIVVLVGLIAFILVVVGLLAKWRTRARAAANPTEYYCPRCMQVFESPHSQSGASARIHARSTGPAGTGLLSGEFRWRRAG